MLVKPLNQPKNASADMFEFEDVHCKFNFLV